MTGTRAPIAVALDLPNLDRATTVAAQVADSVAFLKVGLETYLRDGAAGVAAIRAAAGEEVGLFLDLKLHDIPNTVAGAARSVAPLNPALLTVHASGGPAMIAAAVDALPGTAITAVTILTSLTAADLGAIGIEGEPLDAVVRLARLAVDAGATALVCSPLEVAAVRETVGPDIRLVIPGIRPAGGDLGDQQRVATPEQALADGADLLVIGRPITAAQDPGLAAQEISAALVDA
ncbi:MAG TPA: orotidine-5'-phosphate decarboxylase [Actinobacteria bacterium]|nr:orotidine-5'-phosphate decarboxylase [Actinomycetota bacterium]